MKYGKSYKELFTTFMVIQMLALNKQRWGNNVPRDIFNIDEIIKFYPNSKIIICVRDVRAFLLSYKGKWRVTGDEHKARIQKLYHPVITSFLWKSCIRNIEHIKSLIPEDNLIIVKYEELVTNPKKVIINICKTIGESFEDSMLQINTHNSSSLESKSGIYTSSLTIWRTNLNAEEIIIAQSITKKEMRYLGYNLENIKFNWLKVIYQIILMPWSIINALYVNREMYGNPISFIIRRISILLKAFNN